MILAHHGGEQLLLAAVAGGGTSVVAGLAVFARSQLTAFVRWLRRR